MVVGGDNSSGSGRNSTHGLEIVLDDGEERKKMKKRKKGRRKRSCKRRGPFCFEWLRGSKRVGPHLGDSLGSRQ